MCHNLGTMEISTNWEHYLPDPELQLEPSHAHIVVDEEAKYVTPDQWKDYGIRLRMVRQGNQEDIEAILAIHATALNIYGTNDFDEATLVRNARLSYKEHQKPQYKQLNEIPKLPLSFEESFALHAYEFGELPTVLAINAYKERAVRIEKDGSSSTYPSRYRNYITSIVNCEDPFHIVLLAEDPDTGKVGGYCEINTYHRAAGTSPWGWIDSLYLHPGSQSKHLGSALIQAVKDFYDRQGTTIALQVATEIPACNFYEKHHFTTGYVATGTSPDMDPDVVVPTYMGVPRHQEMRVRHPNTTHAETRRRHIGEQALQGEQTHSLCDHVKIGKSLPDGAKESIRRKELQSRDSRAKFTQVA